MRIYYISPLLTFHALKMDEVYIVFQVITGRPSTAPAMSNLFKLLLDKTTVFE